MITVQFYSQAGLLTGFSLDGHAGRGEEGEDLLCASVSSAAYMTANTITDVMRIQTHVEVGRRPYAAAALPGGGTACTDTIKRV